jgi:hypothetical protein
MEPVKKMSMWYRQKGTAGHKDSGGLSVKRAIWHLCHIEQLLQLLVHKISLVPGVEDKC